MEAKSTRQAVCPECGESFSARGLAGHRRLRHGAQPLAPLPRERAKLIEATPAILNALVALQEAVERIELHLSRSPLVPETPAEEAARVERELSELLQHIVRIKQEGGLASTAIRSRSPENEQRASYELARLRREQARLVYRLDELRQGLPSDERFLT